MFCAMVVIGASGFFCASHPISKLKAIIAHTDAVFPIILCPVAAWLFAAPVF
jgi:hypothetical protein